MTYTYILCVAFGAVVMYSYEHDGWSWVKEKYQEAKAKYSAWKAK